MGNTKMANVAKSAVKQAVNNAQKAANKMDELTKGMSPEQVAALQAILAAPKTETAAAPAKAKAKPADPEAKFTELHHMVCKVIGGKKHKGETVKVFLASSRKNRFGGLAARAENSEGEKVWIDQKHLEIVGPMDAADIKRLDDEREGENNETLYIAANIGVEKDAAVRVDYPGWFKKLWFPKTMITDTGFTMADDAKTPIYEIVAWKVKREVGMDSYMMLKAKQAELEAIVDAK